MGTATPLVSEFSNALYRASSTTRFIPPARHLSLPSKNAYQELFCISSFYFVFSLKEKKMLAAVLNDLGQRVSQEHRISKKADLFKTPFPKCLVRHPPPF